MSRPDQSYLVGLCGSGITYSLTPVLHEYAASSLGIHYLYRPLDILALGPQQKADPQLSIQELLDWALCLGYNAFNITYPYKQAVIPLLDRLSPEAQRLAAVNTLVLEKGQLVGYNTDLTGYRFALTESLKPSSEDLREVTQLGVGGAGSATADALLSLGTSQLSLYDPDQAKAQLKAQELASFYPEAKIRALRPEELAASIASSSGLVNATPIGMHHHPGLPIATDLLHPGLWVSDVIYLPRRTALIQAAQKLGCRTFGGELMALGQGLDAFELITGQRPDQQVMQAYFSSLLDQQLGS